MPKRPPKDWWDKMYKEVKEGNPSYSEEQVRKTVGGIWYNKMSPSKKKKEVKKEKGSMRYEAVYSHSFSPEFYSDLARVLEELWETNREEFVNMVKEVFPGYMDLPGEEGQLAVIDYLPDSLIPDLVQKAIEVDTVTDLSSPVEVWLDPEGFVTVEVPEFEDIEGSLTATRIEAVKARVQFNKKRVIATVFPNLFSSDAKKYIQLEAQRLAANYGVISTPEQANAYIDKAAQELAQQFSDAVSSGVMDIINESRNDILDELVSPNEIMGEPPPEELPPVPPEIQEPIAPPAGPMLGASKRAQHMIPEIEPGTWVMVDGLTGTEWIPADLVDLNEVRDLIDRLGLGEPVGLTDTSLRDFTSNTVAFDIDIQEGYGARLSAPGYLDATEWAVFDTEAEAQSYLEEMYGEE